MAFPDEAFAREKMRLNATQFDAQTPEQQALNHPRTKHVHVTLKDQRDKWIAGDEMDDLGDLRQERNKYRFANCTGIRLCPCSTKTIPTSNAPKRIIAPINPPLPASVRTRAP